MDRTPLCLCTNTCTITPTGNVEYPEQFQTVTLSYFGKHLAGMVWLHLEGRVIANQYKVILYSMMKPFIPDVVSYMMAPTPSTGLVKTDY